MTWIESDTDVPTSVRYHREAVDEIIQSIEEGTYCAVLGPRLCGKTELLRYVTQILSQSMGWTCVYLDLHEMQASTLQGFFADLIRLTSKKLTNVTDVELSLPEGDSASSAVFRGFLSDYMQLLNRDVVFIIEHLEAVPTDLVQALLTSLRAAYMDQQTMDCRMTVVVSGALSLATLTVGESSPFRGIVRRVFIGDLTETESNALIQEYLGTDGINITRLARQKLLAATNGDHFLIREICQRCVELVNFSNSKRLSAGNVNQITSEFLRDEVYQYAPLLEAVRLIEEDPDLLHCILALLEQGFVHRTNLPLPLSPDLDPLYLTGVVERVDGKGYRLQNTIYSQFLEGYFEPGRVGRSLAMAGRWDAALDYLELGIRSGDRVSRSELLSATINSIYASDDMEQAAHFLMRGLLAAFGALEVQVWYAPPKLNRLRLIGNLGTAVEESLLVNPEIEISADRLEARVFREAMSMRGQESDRGIRRAIPLAAPGRNVLGVVTLCEEMTGERFIEQREHDRQLGGYLNQASRAMQAVSTRRQELALAGFMQTSLLTETPPELDGWQFAARLDPARETSGDFFDFIQLPGGKIGIVIADVADKGMGAALYMALSRTLIRTYAPDHADRPDIALRNVSERILSDTQAGLYVTVFYGILNTRTGKLTYCNAGHNPPYLLTDKSESGPQVLHRTGMALGVTYDSRWEPEVVIIPENALLVLYTDGVVDARSPQDELFGDDRLLSVVGENLDQTAQAAQDALISGVRAFVGEEGQFDDMAIVVVKRIPRKPILEKRPPPIGRRVI